MRNSALLISVAFMFAATAALAGQPGLSLKSGTELNATLSASVDSSRAKHGDEVTAKTTQDVKVDGIVVIPKGSKLIGRVTKAGRYSSGGSGGESSSAALGILFDRVVFSDGREISLDAPIVALAAERPRGPERRDPADPALANAGTIASAVHRTGGGALETVGGVVSGPEITAGRPTTTIGPAVEMASRSAGALGGLNSRGRLTPGSRGVFGIDDLEISTAASSGALGTLLISPRRSVELVSGTQLLLVAGGAATSQTQRWQSPPRGEEGQVASRDSGLLIGMAFLLGANAALAGQPAANLEAGTELNATLTASIDSGEVKAGSQVTATVTQDVRVHGVVVIPKGSKLTGRVAKAHRYRPASAAGKSGNAQLSIVFDRALLGGGREVAFNTVIGAVAPEPPSGGAFERVGGMVGVPGITPVGSPGSIGGLDLHGRLKPGSRGVFGIENLEISTNGSTAADGVLTSPRTTVTLESGTQLLLVAGGDTPSQPQR